MENNNKPKLLSEDQYKVAIEEFKKLFNQTAYVVYKAYAEQLFDQILYYESVISEKE